MGPLYEMSEAEWDNVTVAKLKGAFNTIRHASVFMKEQKWGRILNSASDAWLGFTQLAAYSAANAGIVGLTKAAAKDLYRFGVTCNAYCPQAASRSHVNLNCLIRTMLEKQSTQIVIDPKKMEEVERAHGPSEAMSPFLAYLASDKGAYISGSVFSITAGGYIGYYADPKHASCIKKDECPWTMEELIKTVPEQLLKGYVCPASVNDFASK